MSQVNMNVQKYLTRIGFSGPTEPTLEVLGSLHSSHLHSVPFENLTIHSGGRVHLDLPVLYEKIVNQNRGGFCYEVNGLFSWLLRQLGFQVTVLSAQVKSRMTGFYGPPFDHMILMVVIDGKRWLCDVGFGVPVFPTPLSLDTGDLQEKGHRVYRLRSTDGMTFLEWQQEENRGTDGDWVEIYKFTLEPRCFQDFFQMCQYHQTSPCSLFFCKSLCMLFKSNSKVSYIGRRLTTTKFPDGPVGEVEITTRELKDEEVPGILVETFGIVLKSPLIVKDEGITPPEVFY
ncbi:arylamine N-acetyltransferase, pineal gland isozyme NAT-10-like [Takifugu flavidus]|nr:arylamine N-acetyltransferase, pineal gland isozyme NAT-10-like [Takifugu flavidus]